MSDFFASSNGIGGSGAGGAGAPGSGAGGVGATGSGAGGAGSYGSGAGGSGAFGSGAGGSGVGFGQSSSTNNTLSSGNSEIYGSGDAGVFSNVDSATDSGVAKAHRSDTGYSSSTSECDGTLWRVYIFVFSVIMAIGNLSVLIGLSSSSYLEVFLASIFWPILMPILIVLGLISEVIKYFILQL